MTLALVSEYQTTIKYWYFYFFFFKLQAYLVVEL